MSNNTLLVLEDGKVFEGQSLGVIGPTYGEIVFSISVVPLSQYRKGKPD